MLNYKVFYRKQMGSFQAEVPDFPGATAFGMTVAEARDNVLSALRYAAERRIRRGELLPMPDPARTAADAYLGRDRRRVAAGCRGRLGATGAVKGLGSRLPRA
jgi:predicted RNase H-like HicB family nuclease